MSKGALQGPIFRSSASRRALFWVELDKHQYADTVAFITDSQDLSQAIPGTIGLTVRNLHGQSVLIEPRGSESPVAAAGSVTGQNFNIPANIGRPIPDLVWIPYLSVRATYDVAPTETAATNFLQIVLWWQEDVDA